jgi:hypothetical protein
MALVYWLLTRSLKAVMVLATPCRLDTCTRGHTDRQIGRQTDRQKA